MKAAIFYSRDDIRVEDVPRPEIGPEELLVQVHGCGLCGSDIAKVVTGSLKPGSCFGHEAVGTVIEVGEDLQALRAEPSRAEAFRVGQRVAMAHHTPCFSCYYCYAGCYTVCPSYRTVHLDPGGFAEFIRVPAPLVHHATVPIPDGLSFEEAAFVEPLSCCLRGVRRSRVDLGETVLIVGSGAIGLMLAQIAGLYGARVIVTDLIPQRLELAHSLGVDLALHAIDDDVKAAVREATAGRGVDAAICTVPVPRVVVQSLALVRDGGSLNLFAGDPAGTLTEIDLYRVYQHELSIFGTYSHATSELPEALDLIARGKVQVEPLLTHRLPLSRLADGIELTVRHEAMKVYIEMQ